MDPTRILDRQEVFLERVVEDWTVNPMLTYMRKESTGMGTSKKCGVEILQYSSPYSVLRVLGTPNWGQMFYKGDFKN